MAKGKGGPAEKVEARNVLQAVVLADSFTQRFRPISVERPKVLLPLVNVPMLEYTLEWLATNKVQEVYVFCCAHADQIKQHLADSKWAKNRDMVVTTIVSTSCVSVGEALRLIDYRDVIQNDFILVSGDTVSNVNLAPIIKAHKDRRAVDKQAIFTMIMKSTQHKYQRLRLGDSETTVCVDPKTNRLLRYHESDGPGRHAALIKVDTAFFSERDQVQVRTDLMDTHIAVCAPEVLMLFTDNFDFANLKRDFIPGVLSEEELGSKLYVHETNKGEYAARVNNLRSYDAVSRDIMQRWVFPFVPDTNILWRGGAWGPTSYRYSRGQRYYENQVTIDRSAYVGEDVCIGTTTTVGEGSKVVQSVLGRRVQIGKNCDIVGCYIQDDVRIEDGVVMRHALVCDNATVKSGAVVSPGAIISYNVVIAAQHTVPANARISLCKQASHVRSPSEDETETGGAAALPDRTSGGGAVPPPPHTYTSDSEGESDGEGYDSDDSTHRLGMSMEKPQPDVIQIAKALASDNSQSPSPPVTFDTSAVGALGAGYVWVPTDVTTDADSQQLAPPKWSSVNTEEEDREAEEAAFSQSANERSATPRLEDEEEEELDPHSSAELRFKVEVSETLLRCVKLKYDQANAIIELQGLKIAEDRSFACLAKYIVTTLLAMTLPAPTWVSSEFLSLFPSRNGPLPDKKTMLVKFRALLREFKSMLQRFLRTEDDQEELLLTLEDYCSEQDVFANQGEHGHAYADLFAKVLHLAYEEDVLSEEGIELWAESKAQDAEEDQEYLKKAEPFLEWLRNASEDESEDD